MEIIFWNVHNNKHAVDIIAKTDFIGSQRLVAFAEYWEIDDYISNVFSGKDYWIDNVMKRTGFIHSKMNIKTKKVERYFSLITIDYNGIEIYVWIVHLKAKHDSESLSDSINAYITRNIVEEINSGVLEFSMIIGDFNMASCDPKMLEIFHFNSTFYYSVEDRKEKKFNGNTRIKFYNPIASMNGDLSKGPPGTYYYNLPYQSQAWHIYDLALVSYSLSQYLDKEKCEIISELNGVSLMKKNGRPNTSISDHFPIRIKFV